MFTEKINTQGVFRIVHAAIIILICTSIYANPHKKYEFDHISTRNGLSNSIVYMVYQDNEGAIWIATHDGLNRYNGYSFEIYRHDSQDSTSISDNRITYITNDHEGNLWVATRAGLNKYSKEKNTFTRYLHDEDDPNSLPNDWIYYMLTDSKNRLWIGTNGGGVALYHHDIDYFENFLHNPEDNTSISNDNIYSIIEDKKGNIWLGTPGKYINRFNETDKSFEKIEFNPNMPYTRGKAFGTILFEDDQNNIWIGAEGLGLFIYNQNSKTVKHLDANGNNNKSVNNNVITSILTDDDGIIWLTTDGGGINLYNPETRTFGYIMYDSQNPKSLSTNAIFMNFMDNTGTMWMGSFNGGVNIFNKNKSKFDLYTSISHDPNSLSYKSVFGLHQDRKENIWVATDGGGLNLFNKEKNTFKHYMHDPSVPGSLPTNVIKAVYEDSDGNLWLGTFLEGLLLFDRKTGKVTKQYKHDPQDTNSITGDLVWTILEDKDNNLWVGTLDNGLSLFDKKNKRFINYTIDNSKDKGLITNQIFLIYEDKKGMLWLGTENGGLIKFDKEKDQFKSYLNDPDSHHSISHNVVKTIFEDSKGNFWVGTEGGGLNLLDRETEKFKVISKEEGIGGNIIQGILEDETGNLWISTNKGICKFNYSNFTCRNYDISDGLQDNEFAYTVSLKLKSGEMLFGGGNGFNLFDPSKIKDNPYKPPVELTDFKVFNRSVKIGEKIFGDIILSKAIRETEEIKISYKARTISFHFTGLNYTLPQKNTFKYKLENFDKQWYHTNAINRSATYSNLDGGTYYFKVLAANNDGIENPEPLNIKLIVIPPFWKKLWFQLLVVSIILGSIIAFYRNRLNQIKANQVELERQIDLRTDELRQSNSELVEQKEEVLAQNEEIRQQSEELKAQKEHLEAQNEEIKIKNDQISEANSHMEIVSDFGKKITSSLSIEAINDMIYDYVSSLMDTSAFGIGILNEEKQIIEFKTFYELTAKQPYFKIDYNDNSYLATYCLKHQVDIYMVDFEKEYKTFLRSKPYTTTKFTPASIIMLPLAIKDKNIGVIMVLTPIKNAYSNTQLTNLQSLASYIAIAIDNANVYQVVNSQKEHISNSINYALSIQKSILPLKRHLKNVFENFVIFKPKDVVSGDFYWFNEIKEAEKIFLAAVDCTGHGVPGAFMSLIGNRLLNEITNDKKIYIPAQILNLLNRGVQDALKQEQTENNDGMDVCLICIEKIPGNNREIKITFSGAKRPLFIFRTEKNELEVLDGARKSIGGIRSIRSTVEFSNTITRVLKNDTIYLTTDGLVDQNNSRRKKFGTLRLLELLNNLGQLSIPKQKAKLTEALTNHQGNEEQRDDITFIGIRLNK